MDAPKAKRLIPRQAEHALVRSENQEEGLSDEEAKPKEADHAVDDNQATAFLGAEVALLSNPVDGAEEPL